MSNTNIATPEDLLEYRLRERFGFKLSKLVQLIQSRLEAGLEEHGLTRVQWVALSSIEIEKKCSPSDLAQHIGVSRPAISRLLKQMEAQDLIERSLIGDDGRSRQLSLTPKGQDLMHRCWSHVKKTDQYFLDKLTEDEHTALTNAVNKLLVGEPPALEKL